MTQDLIKFVGSLKQFSSITQNTHVNTVLFWFKLNDINLKQDKLRFFKNRMSKRVMATKEHEITINDIKSWYENLSRVDKVMLLIRISSGMRIGELLAFTFDDIQSGYSTGRD